MYFRNAAGGPETMCFPDLDKNRSLYGICEWTVHVPMLNLYSIAHTFPITYIILESVCGYTRTVSLDHFDLVTDLVALGDGTSSDAHTVYIPKDCVNQYQ